MRIVDTTVYIASDDEVFYDYTNKERARLACKHHEAEILAKMISAAAACKDITFSFIGDKTLVISHINDEMCCMRSGSYFKVLTETGVEKMNRILSMYDAGDCGDFYWEDHANIVTKDDIGKTFGIEYDTEESNYMITKSLDDRVKDLEDQIEEIKQNML